jgi:hypothetical protein
LGAAVIVGFLTWIGSAADLAGLFVEWFKDLREEDKTPKLVFSGEFFRTKGSYQDGQTRYYRKGHYIRIKKSSGEGFANDCEGSLTVDTDDVINYSPTVWLYNDIKRYNIGGQADLLLFITDDNKKLISFPIAAAEQGFIEHTVPIDQCIQSELTVNINMNRGRMQGNYSKSIQTIIDNAKQIGSIFLNPDLPAFRSILHNFWSKILLLNQLLFR